MELKSRGLGLAFLAVAALAAAGCGTPAVVKPASAPLPGLARDVQSARNVVAQSEALAQNEPGSGATLP